MSVSAKKKGLRVQAEERVGRLTPEERLKASTLIQENVLLCGEYRECDEVFVYLSFGDEVATQRIVNAAWTDGKTVLVPLYAGGGYRLVEHARGDRMVTGKFGIQEPAGKKDYRPSGRLLALVPGLAFDRNGHRLGRGGGYYDRMLSDLARSDADMQTAGLVYQAALYEDIPVEPFDFDMDIVITENESIRITPGGGLRSE